VVKSKKIYDVKKADQVLGEEKIKDIVEKDWKTAELPSEEELEKTPTKSPMARNNVNSRKNLTQYRKDVPKETKEKIVKNLSYKSKRSDKDLKAFFDGSINDDLLVILQPMRVALVDEDEEEVFFGTIKLFVKDFPKGDLSSSDIDDISSLSLNRILELRLLKESKANPKRILDISSAIERFRKNSEKIKMALSSRRMDRVDTKNKGGFSIVDIAAEFDNIKRRELEEKVKIMNAEEEKFLLEKESK